MLINITNGEEFNDYIQNKIEGLFIPFNEALIDGQPIFPLFDESFIKERCFTHHVDKNLYMEKMGPFLNAILSLTKEDELVLWFGKDMFCQINLLGLLSYLESLKIKNKIYVNIIDDYSKELIKKEIPILLEGFIDSYVALFEKRIFIQTNFEQINNGIKSYLHLFFEDNEIIDFIRENKLVLDRKKLISEVFKRTREYGLGNVQVINLVNKIIGESSEKGS